MSVRDAIVQRMMPGSHPATAWNRYEQYNSPARITARRLNDAYAAGGVGALASTYQQLRQTQPASAFDESQLNTIGYQLLRSGRIKDAIAVFELNVRQYPAASNPYDSLGEAYAADGQVQPAITSYEKSLALDPGNTNAVQALARLRERL
jgi:tetratricopeptide (TPR) repeat protein